MKHYRPLRRLDFFDGFALAVTLGLVLTVGYQSTQASSEATQAAAADPVPVVAVRSQRPAAVLDSGEVKRGGNEAWRKRSPLAL